MSDAVFRIVEDDLTGQEIRALLELHMAGMVEHSPDGSCHYLDFDALNGPDVTFWSIWEGSTLAGCGALLQLDSTHGEVKSMRTAEASLGKGVGRRMVDHIIGVARARGYRRLSLETGSSEAFDAANALYQRVGFMECGPFGTYLPDPFSRFYTMEFVGQQREPVE